MRALRAVGLAACLLCLPAASARGTELSKETVEAFDRYARLTEARIDGETRQDRGFLWVDAQPDERRQALHAQLRRAETIVEPMQTRDAGREIDFPGGMIHHWVATAFIPGVTLSEVLKLSQNYDNYQNIYRPDIERSKLVARNGDDFKVHLRYHKKTLVTVVLNTESDVRYLPAERAPCAHAKPLDAHRPGRQRRHAGRAREAGRQRQRLFVAVVYLLALRGARWWRVPPIRDSGPDAQHPIRVPLARRSPRVAHPSRNAPRHSQRYAQCSARSLGPALSVSVSQGYAGVGPAEAGHYIRDRP